MKHIMPAVALMVALLVGASTARAQHHGGHGGVHSGGHGGGHGGGHIGGHSGGHIGAHSGGHIGGHASVHIGGHYGGNYGGHAVHRGIHYGHNNWNYVVPHHNQFAGAYYSQGATHYYTPTIVTRQVVGVAPVVVQKPVELAFGGFSRNQDLAGRLSVEANAMCLDMHYNYQHNKNFVEVYRAAYNVLKAAKYLHGKEHQGDRETITNRMVEVDALFHDVQDQVRGWSRVVTKQIGASELQQKVEGVEAVLHHLCYDVGVEPHTQPVEEAPPPADLRETIPPTSPTAVET